VITRCPSCHTHFRVYAEQLAARAGQVRCGRCNRVFDALEHLIEEIAPTRATGSKPEFDAPHVNLAEAEQVPEPAVMQMQEPDGPAQERPIPNAEKTADLPEDLPEAKDETPQATKLEPVMSAPAKFEAETIAPASAFDFGPAVAPEPAKPRRRWPWPVGALLMLLLLLAQATYQYRSAIVLLIPEAKPYAAILCAKLGCDLPLPRRIELMSIEASDLQADTANPAVMVLTATIKSRASFNQQHPSLELTLTDAQDQPVVRRVLAPQNYLGAAASIQSGFIANSEIAIKVFIEGSQVKATGYRLYLFYP